MLEILMLRHKCKDVAVDLTKLDWRIPEFTMTPAISAQDVKFLILKDDLKVTFIYRIGISLQHPCPSLSSMLRMNN